MIILYGLKQRNSYGKIYYYDFVENHWSAYPNENTLTSKIWLVQEIGDKYFPDNYEIVRFELKEIKE